MHTETSVINACSANDGYNDLVISCEHGGNRIPKRYSDLFKFHQALLDSHRGFDPGALILAKDLARAFAAPLVASTVSRLLVDLNRSIGHPQLHFEASGDESVVVRPEIVKHYYLPYRELAESLVKQKIAYYGQAIHISCHSFTPEMGGNVRNADIGLLYDPKRPGEVDLCKRWKACLNVCAPALKVRRNYPYKGNCDGLTTCFRERLPSDAYIGIELEINQKHIIGRGRHWTDLRKLIVNSLCRALKIDFSNQKY